MEGVLPCQTGWTRSLRYFCNVISLKNRSTILPHPTPVSPPVLSSHESTTCRELWRFGREVIRGFLIMTPSVSEKRRIPSCNWGWSVLRSQDRWLVSVSSESMTETLLILTYGKGGVEWRVRIIRQITKSIKTGLTSQRCKMRPPPPLPGSKY